VVAAEVSVGVLLPRAVEHVEVLPRHHFHLPLDGRDFGLVRAVRLEQLPRPVRRKPPAVEVLRLHVPDELDPHDPAAVFPHVLHSREHLAVALFPVKLRRVPDREALALQDKR